MGRKIAEFLFEFLLNERAKTQKGLTLLEVVSVIFLSGLCLTAMGPVNVQLCQVYTESLARQQDTEAVNIALFFIEEEIKKADYVIFDELNEDNEVIAFTKVTLNTRKVDGTETLKCRLQLIKPIGTDTYELYYWTTGSLGNGNLIEDQLDDVLICYNPHTKIIRFTVKKGEVEKSKFIDLRYKI
jgi:hypothetical protein